MTPDDTYRLYLMDLVTLLREDLANARERRDAPHPSGESRDFESGEAFAYAAVLSTMVAQAVAFDIPLSEIGLEGFDSDAEMAR